MVVALTSETAKYFQAVEVQLNRGGYHGPFGWHLLDQSRAAVKHPGICERLKMVESAEHRPTA